MTTMMDQVPDATRLKSWGFVMDSINMFEDNIEHRLADIKNIERGDRFRSTSDFTIEQHYDTISKNYEKISEQLKNLKKGQIENLKNDNSLAKDFVREDSMEAANIEAKIYAEKALNLAKKTDDTGEEEAVEGQVKKLDTVIKPKSKSWWSFPWLWKILGYKERFTIENNKEKYSNNLLKFIIVLVIIVVLFCYCYNYFKQKYNYKINFNPKNFIPRNIKINRY